MEIYHIINGKKADATQTENKQFVPCKSSNNALICDWLSESTVINPVNDLIQLMLKESGEIIEWTNPGKYEVNPDSVTTDKQGDNPTTASDETKNNSDKKEEDNPSSPEDETENENKGNKVSFGSYLKFVKTYLIFILVLI